MNTLTHLVGAALALVVAGVSHADGLLESPTHSDFLKVDEAFELQPPFWRDDGSVEVSWRIAKGYYLYRDKLKFASRDAAAKLGAPALPKSTPHEDEHFGKVQIYRDDLFVRLPIAGRPGGKLRLQVTYQGCADAGLCYPPQTRTLEATR